MKRASILVLFLGCNGGTPTPEAESDADTDTDTDADADTDADTDPACAPLGIGADIQPDPAFDDYFVWDEGVAVSACVTGTTALEGELNLFIRRVEGGPDETWCAKTYTVTGVPDDTCPACDFAFEPQLTETGTPVDLSAEGASCDRIGDVITAPRFGVDLDGGAGGAPIVMVPGKGWYPLGPPASTVTITPLGDQLRVDWVWAQTYDSD